MILKHGLSVLAFAVVTFAAQGSSHFVINAEHFEAIGYLRDAPIMPLGFAAMIVQGTVMTLALQLWRGDRVGIQDGFPVAGAFGIFLASYIVLAEPAKYAVPDIPAWMGIEILVAAIQFIAFGALLGFIHSWLGGADRPAAT